MAGKKTTHGTKGGADPSARKAPDSGIYRQISKKDGGAQGGIYPATGHSQGRRGGKR